MVITMQKLICPNCKKSVEVTRANIHKVQAFCHICGVELNYEGICNREGEQRQAQDRRADAPVSSTK